MDNCDNLVYAGHDDWRLPDPFELDSILDDGRFGPAIYTAVFPGTPSDWFWSSSSYAVTTINAWCVNFYDSNVSNGDKDSAIDAHCVRLGP